MSTQKTPAEMELMARGITDGEQEHYWEFGLYFGPRFRALARKERFSEINAEIYADDCCEQILQQTQRYFDLKAKGNTDDCFYEQWVFWKAKLIRRRFHSAIHWTQAQRDASDENAQERKEAKTNWLQQNNEFLSERMSLADKAAFLSAFEEALNELSELQRAIFLLREVDGCWSYADIAKKYKLSANAARVCCHRAKQKLRARFSKTPFLQKELAAKQ